MKKLLVVLFVSMTLFLGCSDGGGSSGGEGPGGGPGGGGGDGSGGSSSSQAIQLTEGVWTDGNIAAGGEQWFKFKATNETLKTQYIHIELGSLIDLYAQIYEADGTTKTGSQANINNSSSNKYFSSYSVLGGKEYLIKVWPKNSSDSGTYQILFNKSTTAPIKLPTNAIMLTANVWVDGKFTSNEAQWFKFTATAATQYIQTNLLTIKGVSIQLYDKDGNQVTSKSLPPFGGEKYFSQTVTVGDDYYIKVTPGSSTYRGIYQIGFNENTTQPKKMALPFPNAAELTIGIWTDGYIPASTDEQWFKFKATASSQFIHTVLNTLASLDYQLYDSEGNHVGEYGYNNSGSESKYVTRTVISGKDYYIRVWPSGERKGSYLIGFTEDYQPPVQINLPFPNATQLTADTLTNGDTTASDTQWFKFNATSDTQYIHAVFVTLNSTAGIYVQLYDATGKQVDDPTTYSVSKTYSQLYDYQEFTYRKLTAGKDYYIKVWPYNGSSSPNSGTYQITFSTMPMLSTAVVTPLTLNTWANGNIPSSGKRQWYKFTATSPTYIHGDFTGTLSSSSGVNVYLYDINGIRYDYSSTLSGSNLSWNPSNTNPSSPPSIPFATGQEYYLLVGPSSGASGTYKIAFSSSATPPTTP